MKTYILKECTFTADVPTANAVRALNDAEIDALVKNAMSSWAYRRGAKADNDRKHFTIAMIVADMLASGERGGADGGLTKTDEREIAALFKAYGLTCADDIIRGQKSEADADKAVARFAEQQGLDVTPYWSLEDGKRITPAEYEQLDPAAKDTAVFTGLIDSELAASDNAVVAFQVACDRALNKAIAAWNVRVGPSGQHTRANDTSTLTAALAFLRTKRAFIKGA